MAHAEQLKDLQSRRQRSLERTRLVGGVAAIFAPAAAGALWLTEGVLDEQIVPGLMQALMWLATVFTMVWLVSSAERRVIDQLNRVELTRYRDGYVDGYVDATSRRGAVDGHPPAPQQR